ncbi:MAG: glycoside hydrolase family 3 protein [Gammaproteobacteria bacterium]|nr:glycoside hydrolase family 3 protein [Gammaproteobacteria bacterium]
MDNSIRAVTTVKDEACSPARMRGTVTPWPSRASPFDPAHPYEQGLARTVDGYLRALSVEQKVGQMIQAEIANATPAEVSEFALGSVLNGGGSQPHGNKHASVEDWLALADAYHDAACAGSADRGTGSNAIPVLWGTDAVHGHSNVYGATVFPHNIGLGATRDADLIDAIGVATAKEVAATGLDWTFAPTLAVVRDDRWGRTYEGYSEHPDVVAEYAPRMVKGLQGAPDDDDFLGPGRILATSKHFVGEGQTTDGRDQGDVDCSEQTLCDLHAGGHLAAIRAGVQTVMAAYNSWQGSKVHSNRYLLTDVLKGALRFDGFVVSDWDGFLQVAADPGDACARSVNAGVDMLMVGVEWRRTYHDLLHQVRSGAIPMARVDDAVRRILRVKARTKLFSGVRPSERPAVRDRSVVGAPSHRELARRAVRSSLVMLKNDGVLPLRRDARVLLAGNGADNIGKQCGGWTLTWQGTGNDNADFPKGSSIFDGFVEAVAGNGGTAVLRADGCFDGQSADVGVVVFGEDPYAEGDGDRNHLSYSAQDSEPLAILRTLKERGIPTVAVFLTGRPMWVNPELNAADAFVVAWLPGTEGAGVADVMFRGPDGDVGHDFRGKLSFSWPGHPLQTPLNLGDTGYSPLFPYGFGLRYRDGADGPGVLDETDATHGRPVRCEPSAAGSSYPR